MKLDHAAESTRSVSGQAAHPALADTTTNSR